MAIGIHMVLPEGLGVDEYRAVNAAIKAQDDAVAGLLFHQAIEQEGKVNVYDVWESRQAFDTFQQERLGPTIAATVGADRMGDGPPEVDEYEVLDYITGDAA